MSAPALRGSNVLYASHQIPSDRLIAEVAHHIYKVDKSTLSKLFAKGALPKLG